MKTLVRYKPQNVGTSRDFFRDFDRMLDGFFSGHESSVARTPTVDIREEDEQYVLEAELAGLSEKDVDVKVQDNLLTISAETESEEKEEKKEDKKSYILRERRSSSFMRSFVLPKDVDQEHIDAAFKNGVLTLTLPKSQESKPRTIKVENK